MLGRGLEPPRISPPVPKTDAATNYATRAYMIFHVVTSKIPDGIFSRPRLAVFAFLFAQTKTSLRLAHESKTRSSSCFLSCAPTWIRTKDQSLKRRVLYQLSYGRMYKKEYHILSFFSNKNEIVQSLSIFPFFRYILITGLVAKW